jgi:ABC-type Fe3+ transport system permease subunit
MPVSLGDAAAMALSFVFFVVVLGVGATVLTGIQGTQTAGTYAYNSTTEGLKGMKNLSDQSGVLGTIIGAAVIIGVLVGAFYFAKQS